MSLEFSVPTGRFCSVSLSRLHTLKAASHSIGIHVHMCVAGCLIVERMCARRRSQNVVFMVPPSTAARVMDRFERVKKIGEGSFGKALLVKQKDSGKLLVVKEIGISKVNRVFCV